MDETKQRMVETRGLRGAEAAAVLRFGMDKESGAAGDGGTGDGTPAEGPVFERVAGQQTRPGGRVAVVGSVTLAVLLAAGVGFPHSGQDPAYGGRGAGSVDGPEGVAADRSVADRAGVTQQEPAQMSISRNSVRATMVAGVALIAASAGAQNAAVQWRVEDGGNKHWYQVWRLGADCRDQSRLQAQSSGGYLATITSSGENQLIYALVQPFYGSNVSIGGYFDFGSGSWQWVSGEAWNYTNWQFGEPGCCLPNEWWLDLNMVTGEWRDRVQCIDPPPPFPGIAVVEWSADCNKDGIVDYSQCHDGTLADYNGNNISDCCEQGAVCVVENWPVQWRVEDGGNGHWYQVRQAGLVGWSRSRQLAEQSGGYLATLTTARESAFVASLITTNRGVNLGGYQDTSAPDFDEPGGGWRWVTGEPWTYTNWLVGEPNNEGANENCLMFAQTNAWGDKWADQSELCPPCEPHYYVIEWSADCNHDNIVDYGQILLGQLADANGNGIPDICEGPTCHDVDLYRNGRIDGADLAALLSEWGLVNATTRSDFNRNGRVDGSDLATLLSNWGPCPQ